MNSATSLPLQQLQLLDHLGDLFNPKANSTKSDVGASCQDCASPTAATPTAQDLFQLGVPSEGGAQTDLSYYRSEMRSVSLAAQFSQATAQIAGGDGDAGGNAQQVAAQQMTFQFYGESRVEELAQFNQRVGAASKNLSDNQKESFAQVSRQAAVRFSLSINVSAQVLQGVAGGAEALQGASDDAFNQFVGFTKDALSKADDIVNEIFKLIAGFLNGDRSLDVDTFQKKMNKFLADIQNAFSPSQGQLAAPGQQQGQGSAVSFQSFQMEFKLEFQSTTIVGAQVQESDPITFDLDDDGVELSSYQSGAQFDITASGKAVQTAFVTGGDAFLALDRNNNGVIDNGAELFGDQRGASNGYEELAKLDSNRDGTLNSKDADFGKLRLFRDNGNGKTEAGELISLAQAGIQEIALGYKNVNEAASGGNRITQTATFKRNDGSYGKTADAVLKYLA